MIKSQHPTPTPLRRLGARSIVWLSASLLMMAGCGDAGDAGGAAGATGAGVSEPCADSSDCASGLLCIGAQCTDPGGADTSGAVGNNGTTSGATTGSTGGTTGNTTGGTTGSTTPAPPPCLEILGVEDGLEEVTALLDFGLIPVGATEVRTLTLSNCSTDDELNLFATRLVSMTDAFSLTQAVEPEAPIAISPGQSVEAQIQFAPMSPGAYEGQLEVVAGSLDAAPRRVPLTGSSDACSLDIESPVALARFNGSDDPPMPGMLEMPVGRSVAFLVDADPDTTQQFEWSVIEQPVETYVSFDPGTGRNASLILYTVGRYVIEQRTLDESGVPGCEANRIVIDAVPDSDLHIQLTWNTPGDPHPFNTGAGAGADVDLHLLNPRGTWNMFPWDCYWQNNSPDWGEQGERGDDPSLIIDSTQALLYPESIALNQPEDVMYRVGVYYFAPNDFGPSYANLRVYVRGQLTLELLEQELAEQGDFWEAATLDWSTQEFESGDVITSGFP